MKQSDPSCSNPEFNPAFIKQLELSSQRRCLKFMLNISWRVPRGGAGASVARAQMRRNCTVMSPPSSITVTNTYIILTDTAQFNLLVYS